MCRSSWYTASSTIEKSCVVGNKPTDAMGCSSMHEAYELDQRAVGSRKDGDDSTVRFVE